jgi:hypothetical protein
MARRPVSGRRADFPATPIHTTRMRIPGFAAAAAALLSLALCTTAVDAAAQSADTVAAATENTPPSSLRKGAWSLSFAAPGAGGERAEFGAWEMVGARTNLGLMLGINVSGTDAEGNGATITESSTGVDLSVNLKRYVTEPAEVTPYLLGSVFIGGSYQRRDGPEDFEASTRTANAGVRGAVGVEWFPVRRFSVSGHTGFVLSGGRFKADQEYPDGTEQDTEGTQGAFRSFTSALTVQIYFR